LFILDFRGVQHRAVFSQDQYNAFFTDRPPHLTMSGTVFSYGRYVVYSAAAWNYFLLGCLFLHYLELFSFRQFIPPLPETIFLSVVYSSITWNYFLIGCYSTITWNYFLIGSYSTITWNYFLIGSYSTTIWTSFLSAVYFATTLSYFLYFATTYNYFLFDSLLLHYSRYTWNYFHIGCLFHYYLKLFSFRQFISLLPETIFL
jgi:hypothetical protein